MVGTPDRSMESPAAPTSSYKLMSSEKLRRGAEDTVVSSAAAVGKYACVS